MTQPTVPLLTANVPAARMVDHSPSERCFTESLERCMGALLSQRGWQNTGQAYLRRGAERLLGAVLMVRGGAAEGVGVERTDGRGAGATDGAERLDGCALG